MHQSKVWIENHIDDPKLLIKKFRNVISNSEYYLFTNTDDVWSIDSMILKELGVERGKPLIAIVGEQVSGIEIIENIRKDTPVLMLDLSDRRTVSNEENHDINNKELTLDDVLNQINEYNNIISERFSNNSEIKINLGFTWISA